MMLAHGLCDGLQIPARRSLRKRNPPRWLTPDLVLVPLNARQLLHFAAYLPHLGCRRPAPCDRLGRPQTNYQSVASIIEHRLDGKTAPLTADGAPILHANIRGSRYYH